MALRAGLAVARRGERETGGSLRNCERQRGIWSIQPEKQPRYGGRWRVRGRKKKAAIGCIAQTQHYVGGSISLGWIL